MKTVAQAQQEINSGLFAVIAEARTWKAEHRHGVSKAGKPYDFKSLTVNCEVGDDLVSGDVMLPDETDVDKFRPDFRKGDKILLRLSCNQGRIRFASVEKLATNGK